MHFEVQSEDFELVWEKVPGADLESFKLIFISRHHKGKPKDFKFLLPWSDKVGSKKVKSLSFEWPLLHFTTVWDFNSLGERAILIFKFLPTYEGWSPEILFTTRSFYSLSKWKSPFSHMRDTNPIAQGWLWIRFPLPKVLPSLRFWIQDGLSLFWGELRKDVSKEEKNSFQRASYQVGPSILIDSLARKRLLGEDTWNWGYWDFGRREKVRKWLAPKRQDKKKEWREAGKTTSVLVILLMSSLEDSLLVVVELLACLGQERLVDVRDDTSSSNSSFDKSVELFVSSDGQLEMSWCDSLHLQVLAGVSSKLEDLSGEVFENSSWVDSGSGSDSLVGRDSLLDESVDSSNWELRLEMLTWSPALTDLDLADFFDFPAPTFPPLPPLAPLPACAKS